MSGMPPPRSTSSSTLETAHSLALLSEYTHTLDSLPLELSRNFADLRELDAVLSSSMSTLTNKVTQLTSMLENRTASKEDALWLLADIAEEANRLKPGADDKIRVASHAADSLRGQRNHMKTLLEHMPDDDFGKMAGMLSRKTVYPHVATRSYMPSGMSGEGGRRHRRTALLVNNNVADATQATTKRKRATGADDIDPLAKSPRKERAGANGRGNNGRKKADRAASPTESILSVASHLPQPIQQSTSRQSATGRGSSAASTAKRARTQADPDPPSREFMHPPPSTHPSLPPPFANGRHETNGNRNGVSEWTHGQLEGPGMPVARSFVPPTPAAGTPAAEDTDGGGAAPDGDADGDDGKMYCFCNRGSYGEMIGCEDDTCEREWFHYGCVGLTVAPSGAWYCDECLAKRNSKRTARGGKRRAGGGRAAARNASA